MKFKFHLLPIDTIEPWGADEETPSLFWFALTFGSFWIVVGDQEIFRYSEANLNYWQERNPLARPALLPYDDYQVARPWGDLLDMLPAILDPVPDDLASLLANATAWRDREEHARNWLVENAVDSAGDIYERAYHWWQNRTWDAAYLVHPPNLWMWRVENDIHVRWDNRDIEVDGIPVWSATQGEITLPVADFIAAVESFHTRFVGEMAERVAAIVDCGGIAGVDIDLAALAREQADRSTWLKPAVDPWAAAARRAFTWDQVRDAIRTIGS